MKIVYACSGSMLQVYYDLHKKLCETQSIDDVGFYISDKQYFEKFCVRNPEFKEKYHYLTEWDLLDKVSDQYDLNVLNEYQEKYFKEYSMWYSMVADRRIFLGKYTKIDQDHKPSYSYNKMMSLIEHSVIAFEKFLQSISPDFVVGYSSATFGDHILFGMAEKMNMPFMNLRHTKIKNYMTFTRGLDEKYKHISHRCSQLDKHVYTKDANVQMEVKDYIFTAQKGKVAYSGHREFEMKWQSLLTGIIKSGLRAILVDIKYIGKKKDHHSSTLKTLLFLHDRPFRAARLFLQNKKFRLAYKSLQDITEFNYVFFPLHAEPEVSLSVLAKQYQNQIEVVRNIAMQLPINYKLLVKDHPRNIGRRSTKYLEKLLEIPNVDIVRPDINSLDIIKTCDMTIILSGFVGFEAVLQKKPVITLGKTMLSLLPDEMVKHVDNVIELRASILNMFDNYNYNEEALQNYLYSIISQSVPIDLMTVLLRKEGRKGKKYTKELYEKNIEYLANNLMQSIG